MTYTVHLELSNGQNIELANLDEPEKQRILSGIQCRADMNYISSPFLTLRDGLQLVNCTDIVLVTVKEE